MNSDKLSLKLTHSYAADIKGHGSFPIDMLRYDRAIPFAERDSHVICQSLNPMLGNPRPFSVRIIKYGVGAKPVWAVDRWASYHCEVKEVNSYDRREGEA